MGIKSIKLTIFSLKFGDIWQNVGNTGAEKFTFYQCQNTCLMQNEKSQQCCQQVCQILMTFGKKDGFKKISRNSK